jgi:glycosyltransferase involved in cell wall biosynthesis
VHRLAEAVAARGHHVDVVHSVDAYRLRHPAEPEVAFDHHPHVRLHPLASARPRLAALAAHQLGRPALYGRRLRELLDGGGHDVIHYHNVSLVGGPGVLELGSAVKLYTAHEYWLLCPTHVLFSHDRAACTEKRCLSCALHAGRPPQLWRSTGLLRRCLRRLDALLVPSRFALERHRAEGLDVPLVHLPHFVPDAAPLAIAAASALPDRPFFLYVGRLEKLKGVQDLLRLFADYRLADLVVVGTGAHEQALREQAARLPHVRFLGALHPAALEPLYRAAQGVLVPSLCYETFGLSAAEALARGTPAVVRRIGALTELIEESGGGHAFTDLEDCRAFLERLRTQPGLRAELGRRGAAHARQCWSEETHIGQYLSLVGSLIERKGGRTACPQESRTIQTGGARA